jgi:hypothetical protein
MAPVAGHETHFSPDRAAADATSTAQKCYTDRANDAEMRHHGAEMRLSFVGKVEKALAQRSSVRTPVRGWIT